LEKELITGMEQGMVQYTIYGTTYHEMKHLIPPENMDMSFLMVGTYLKDTGAYLSVPTLIPHSPDYCGFTVHF